MLENGWTVFGTGRTLESLKSIQAEFPQFIPIQADFTKNADLVNIANAVSESGLTLQLSVQNAGMKSPPRPLSDYTCENIDEVTAVNLLAPMKLAALLSPYMQSGSRILFVTSRAATLKLKKGSTYCASKAGLDEIKILLCRR